MKRNKPYPLYELPLITDLKDMINRRNESDPDGRAFSYSTTRNIINVTASEFRDDVNALGTYFYSRGWQGKHIAVIGENSYKWVLAFMAIVNGGSVAVPIDRGVTGREAMKLMDKSDCSAVVVSDLYGDTEMIREESGLDVIFMSEIKEYVKIGKKMLSGGDRDFYEYEINENAIAAIFFTSGTTGESKGVMLSHKNMASDINAACKNFELTGDSMAVLPFHHTFGLVTAVFKAFNYGKCIFINRSLKRLKQDIDIAKPQTAFLVPLFVEKFHRQIIATAKKTGKYGKLKAAMKFNSVMQKTGADLSGKLFPDIKAVFGGKLEYIICGGAPLQQKYIDDFRCWGIIILNGYGITECSPVLSVNRNYHIKDGSVGLVLDGCEVMADENSEILVKGDNVMLGYYRDKEATEKAMEDGWYHTGDLGYVDESGFLFLTGRKKNLIILSNGENVSPEELESCLYADDAVAEAVVYEENNAIIAEIFPTEDYIDDKAYFDDLVRNINEEQPKFRRISEVRLRETEFVKNSTQKIMRHKIREERRDA